MAAIYTACAVAIFLVLFYVPYRWLSWSLVAGLLWVCVWQTYFFRVPKRKRNASSSQVTSVADGKVVILERAFESECLFRECIQLSVYMNFFDVHANFWPVDGKIICYKYFPGEHFLAFNPKASMENEHTCVSIVTVEGHELVFKQVAGGFARRIVNYSEPGMEVTAGKQCGIIKFGSRIDIFLPLDSRILVQKGQLVRACETVIAELPPASRPGQGA